MKQPTKTCSPSCMMIYMLRKFWKLFIFFFFFFFSSSVYTWCTRLWKLLNCKNGAQEKKTLSLTTGKRIAVKHCTQGCLKRTWLTSEGIFVRFLGVLRGERAHCKNNPTVSSTRCTCMILALCMFFARESLVAHHISS